MASSVLLRWISRNAAAACRSPKYLGGCGARMISAMSVSDDNSVPYPSTLPSRTSPWLMLPPAFEGGDNMVYKFYSLAENKVLSVNKRSGAAAAAGEFQHDDSQLVGSSHGWLILFNKKNLDLFLSNPLTLRHIKLPPIQTLPIRESNLRYGCGCVSKVVISCSPDEENCRAIMSFGPTDRLAFCCPGRSTEWTPIGDLYSVDKLDGKNSPREYKDFAYSRKQNLFFCVTKYDDFEAWDLREPGSPKMIPLAKKEKYNPWAARSNEEMELKWLSQHVNFLIVTEPNDELLLVRRHVLQSVHRDGSIISEEEEDLVFDVHHKLIIKDGLDYYVDSKAEKVIFENCFPHKTMGFDVYKYDPDFDLFWYMDRSLDGLALFLGENHGFAVSASEFPELKPNSIYFTDIEEMIPADDACPYGGHDIGIFDYERKIFSPCYYPCDAQSIKRIFPAPMWFSPVP